MTNGWPIKRIGDVVQKTETVNPLSSPDAEFDYVDVSSVCNERFEIGETQRLKGKDAPSRARRLIRTDDVIFATIRPTLKRIAVVPESLDRQICSTGYTVLRPTPDLDHRFLFYALLTEPFMQQMAALQKGASYPAVTEGEVRAQPIPLPPLPEQRRIVGILDEAFAAIATAKANAEKNLQNARDVFESKREASFVPAASGWAKKRIGEIAKAQYGLSEPMNEEGRGYKIFRMGEVQDGRLVDTGRMKFANIPVKEFEKYKLRPRDVLFNRTNSFELVGKTGIFDLAGDYCFASYLVRLNLDTTAIAPEFINYLMNSARFQTRVKSKASKSINQANINASILCDEIIFFPTSVATQREIVQKLDSLRAETERLEDIVMRKLSALEALKKSLLHHAFGGRL